jgi:hypothetical protein
VSLNLQQRFLLWFADYRQLRDENVRLGDEVLSLRGQLEVERGRFDELRREFSDREVALNNRLLAVKFPVEIQRERREGPPPETGAKEWKQGKMQTFHETVASIAAKSTPAA